jgi:hypothetical protein
MINKNTIDPEIKLFTTIERTDGFGAQFQNIIFDILYTFTKPNSFYVFPDKLIIGHNYDNDPLHTKKLIDYMNLESYFKLDNMNNVEKLNHHVVYPFCEGNLSTLMKTPIYHKIQSIFFSNKKSPFNNSYINVACHIRRSNICDGYIGGAEVSNSYYLKIINFLRIKNTNNLKIKFHIYTQSIPKNISMLPATYKDNNLFKNIDITLYDLKDFLADDIELHIDENIIETFNGLVFADILVTSESSFSYSAALLTKGIVYYKKFWHPPADTWIIGDDL